MVLNNTTSILIVSTRTTISRTNIPVAYITRTSVSSMRCTVVLEVHLNDKYRSILYKRMRESVSGWVRPGLGVGAESAAAPDGDDANYEGGQLQDLDQRDDGHADPEAELTADVRDETNDVVIGRLGRLDDVTVGDVHDDTR